MQEENNPAMTQHQIRTTTKTHCLRYANHEATAEGTEKTHNPGAKKKPKH
jgi:hypothetical protein